MNYAMHWDSAALLTKSKEAILKAPPNQSKAREYFIQDLFTIDRVQ